MDNYLPLEYCKIIKWEKETEKIWVQPDESEQYFLADSTDMSYHYTNNQLVGSFFLTSLLKSQPYPALSLIDLLDDLKNDLISIEFNGANWLIYYREYIENDYKANTIKGFKVKTINNTNLIIALFELYQILRK